MIWRVNNMVYQNNKGVSLLEMLVTCAIIGTVAIIGIVMYGDAAKKEEGTHCYYNILSMEDAFSKYRLAPENRTKDPASIALTDLTAFLKDGSIPTCPSGGTYSLEPDGRVKCSLKTGDSNKHHDDGRP
jgi:hypothetical protein